MTGQMSGGGSPQFTSIHTGPVITGQKSVVLNQRAFSPLCFRSLLEEPYLNDPEAPATSTVRHNAVKCGDNTLLHFHSALLPSQPAG
ncbi:hypothetical protein NQZ68_016564 [Dissostichus eleginoides]|nr:hypothetical protein NQZ68_016564 [Dissostichus eleginoides]